MTTQPPPTGADLLVRCLRDQGVGIVFGYPGGQMTPLYDALYRDAGIRHVLARDEQAAAFMADGYARATGRQGVCLAVCGPGVYNAATALATSFTDSVPVLLLSGQVPSQGLGLRSGYYHENDQLHACTTWTKARGRALSVGELPGAFHRVFASVASGRPGPGLFEVPVDVLRADASAVTPGEPVRPEAPRAAAGQDIEKLVELLSRWQRPLLIAGGGVLSAGAEVQLLQLAERLGAPVLHTLVGKSAFPADHPLAARLPWHQATSDLSNMGEMFSPLLRAADGLLALGCRFSQPCTGSWLMPVPPGLAQIDIDPAELGRHFPVQLGLAGDLRETLNVLLGRLPAAPRPAWTRPQPPPRPWRLPGLDLVGPLRRVLPRDAVVVADITRLSYILLAEFPAYRPRTFLHPAGFVAMGYGLPAALGAKAAFPDRAVVAVVGDGCFQMCGLELATAVQERLPVVVVLINDNCLTLIKSTQQRRYESRFLGVDLRNPDFGLFAQAYGVPSWRVTDDAAFEKALGTAVACGEPALVEVQLRE